MPDRLDEVAVERRRWPPARQTVGAVALASSAILAAVYMRGLALRYTCPDALGDFPDVSYAWLKLLAGTCVLAAGAAAVLIRHTALRRAVWWVTGVCALPVLVAWVQWLGLQNGCSS
jgi:hypothetical protein